MYVAEIPNRTSPPAVLLRESFRENGKVKNRTLANLTSWPRLRIEALRRVISNGSVVSRKLLKFTTIWGICFRSKSNSNDWNGCSSDAVLAQLRSSDATTA